MYFFNPSPELVICPAHDEVTPSLAIWPDGTVCCYSGCTEAEVMLAIEKAPSSLISD